MTRPATWMVALLLAATSACGAGERKEREVMKPEETVVRDLVTAPDKARDRADAALDAHRDTLERRLAEDEGAAADDR